MWNQVIIASICKKRRIIIIAIVSAQYIGISIFLFESRLLYLQYNNRKLVLAAKTVRGLMSIPQTFENIELLEHSLYFSINATIKVAEPQAGSINFLEKALLSPNVI